MTEADGANLVTEVARVVDALERTNELLERIAELLHEMTGPIKNGPQGSIVQVDAYTYKP